MRDSMQREWRLSTKTEVKQSAWRHPTTPQTAKTAANHDTASAAFGYPKTGDVNRMSSGYAGKKGVRIKARIAQMRYLDVPSGVPAIEQIAQARVMRAKPRPFLAETQCQMRSE